jgi:hypothetical protein
MLKQARKETYVAHSCHNHRCPSSKSQSHMSWGSMMAMTCRRNRCYICCHPSPSWRKGEQQRSSSFCRLNHNRCRNRCYLSSWWAWRREQKSCNNKQTKKLTYQRDSRRNINVPHTTVFHRNSGSYAGKDGSSANKGSNECDHCVKISKGWTIKKVC